MAAFHTAGSFGFLLGPLSCRELVEAGVRVISGDKTGYAFTEEITEEALLRAAEVASYIARGTDVIEPVAIGSPTQRQTFGSVQLPLEVIADSRRLEEKAVGMLVMPLVTEGGWYNPNGMLLLPPSAFFLIGLFIWCLRSVRTEQVEKPDFKMAGHTAAREGV